MKSNSLWFTLALIASVLVALSLWSAPQLNSPASADTVQLTAAQPTPAASLPAIGHELVANVQRMGGTLLALLCAAGFAFVAVAHRTRRGRLVSAINDLPANVGTHHGGKLPRLTDAAIATRNLIGKVGSDADHVAVAGAADIPIGVITDEAAAAEQPVNITAFGSAGRTLPGVASEAIAAGDFIVSAANGKVRKLPAAAGTYYIIGRAVTATGADGDPIEFDPIPCVQRVVA